MNVRRRRGAAPPAARLARAPCVAPDARHPLRAAARAAALQAELARLARLPANSAYAQRRAACCRRALQLLAAARTAAEADELERLLGGLSL